MNLRGARLGVKLSQPNRRKALALVATFPAVASTAALATGSPDAELLRLGERLDRVIANYFLADYFLRKWISSST
jgi:hypothetical protein